MKAMNDAVDWVRHPKIGWFLMYPSENPFSKFILAVIVNLAGIQHRQFGTLEQCLELLIQMDPILPTVDEMMALHKNIQSL